MGHITLALVVVACLGLLWPTTRQLGLLCAFGLCIILPVSLVVVALVLIGLGAFVYFKQRK